MEALQTLIACIDERERWWNAETVARKLAIPREAAHAALDQLAGANLLDIRVSDDVRYRFRPGSPQLEARAAVFADAYRKDPAPVLEIMRTRKPQKKGSVR